MEEKIDWVEIFKRGLVASIPYILIFLVIPLGLYLHALIVQDTITQAEAELYGYITLGFVGAILILVVIMLNDDNKMNHLNKKMLIILIISFSILSVNINSYNGKTTYDTTTRETVSQ